MGLIHVDPAEHILADSWEKLASEAGFAFCANEGIYESFASSDFASKTLVSAYSDYGIHEQESVHPNADLLKTVQSINWNHVASLRDNYVGIQLGPTCDKEKCRLEDKYSIKIDRYTISTFTEIPGSVATWFVANLNVEHPKMEWIPFGLNQQPPGYTYLAKHFNKPKTGLLYVNFQNHTSERIMLKHHYSRVPWATFRPSAQIPIDTYLEEVASHKFVLCPFGNGLDCYRVYESIYLGCIPILQECRMTKYMADAGLPVLTMSDLSAINERFLEAVWDKAASSNFDYKSVTASYWRKRFLELI